MKPDPSRLPVFIVGVKHTGKSVIARRVSQEIGGRFLDIDAAIVDRHAERTGRRLSVREIYLQDGGRLFRKLEAEICREAAHSDAAVVAAGGGLCDNEEARACLAGARMIALDADPAELFSRIMRRGRPAFIGDGSRAEQWEEFRRLCERRSAEYREMAEIAIDTRNLSLRDVTAEVTEHIREGLHGGK